MSPMGTPVCPTVIVPAQRSPKPLISWGWGWGGRRRGEQEDRAPKLAAWVRFLVLGTATHAHRLLPSSWVTMKSRDFAGAL